MEIPNSLFIELEQIRISTDFSEIFKDKDNILISLLNNEFDMLLKNCYWKVNHPNNNLYFLRMETNMLCKYIYYIKIENKKIYFKKDLFVKTITANNIEYNIKKTDNHIILSENGRNYLQK